MAPLTPSTPPGPARRRGPSRRTAVLVVVALLAVINLPLVHGAWVARQVGTDGVDVVAEVVETRATSGGGGLVEFRMPADVDSEQRTWQAAVGSEAFDRAEDDGTLEVRVVPDDPARYKVAGQQGAGLLRALTVFADVVLLLALVVLVRRRPRELRLVALEDVRRPPPGGRPRLERLSGTAYLVVGEVTAREDDVVVLDTGDQRVRIDLAGHENPVGYEQPAQVRCGLPESPA